MTDFKKSRKGAEAPFLNSKGPARTPKNFQNVSAVSAGHKDSLSAKQSTSTSDKLNNSTRLIVRIEKLAVGGAGIARHEGLVIFVAQAAPGDELEIEITFRKKNYAEAHIQTILSPGPSRREPPCPVASVCGGCNWQHLHESEQQAQKEKIVFETLRKFLSGKNFDYLPIKPSPRSLRYRNRIQPTISHGHFGFFERESHRVVDILDCPITEETLAEKIPEVRQWALSQKITGRLEMYLTPENEVRYNFVDEADGGIGFSQVNRFQNNDLIQTVLAWSDNFSYEQIFDLYGGSGNFSFPLFERFQVPITAVELSAKLVRRGREISLARSLNTVHFIEYDVEKYLEKNRPGPHDLVILDPPRAGCSENTMRYLADAQPRKIIYISCHPVSLARDLKWFFEWSVKLGKNDLKLKRVQAFEMFPQTDHVETIAELQVDS